jgi:hypothetical protein
MRKKRESREGKHLKTARCGSPAILNFFFIADRWAHGFYYFSEI